MIHSAYCPLVLDRAAQRHRWSGRCARRERPPRVPPEGRTGPDRRRRRRIPGRNHVLVDGPHAAADAVRAHTEELVRYVIPAVSADEAELARSLLADAGAACVGHVTTPDVARQAAAESSAVRRMWSGWIETELPAGIPRAHSHSVHKDGNLAVRQPRDGAAGAALDPYRSKFGWCKHGPAVRTCTSSICAPSLGRISRRCSTCRSPSSTQSSKSKRLIHEAKIEPTGAIYDVMTAVLADGRSASVAR